MEAQLCYGQDEQPVEVEDISMGGAKLRIQSGSPATKIEVTLKVPPFGKVTGIVAWARRNAVGVRFNDNSDKIGQLLYDMASYGNTPIA